MAKPQRRYTDNLITMNQPAGASDVVNRLRGEFLEMPGLRLTPEQVQRLCGVERTTCRAALDSLVNDEFLCVKSDGHYARRRDGSEPLRLRAVKAGRRAEDIAKKAS